MHSEVWDLTVGGADYRLTIASSMDRPEGGELDPAGLALLLALAAREPWSEAHRALLEIQARLSGVGTFDPVGMAPGGDEQLERELELALRSGRLVARRMEHRPYTGPLPAVAPHPRKKSAATVTPAMPSEPLPEEPVEVPKTWFEVRVVDCTGAALPGVALVFRSGGETRQGTSGSDGRARFEDVQLSFGSLRLASVSGARDLLAPRLGRKPDAALLQQGEVFKLPLEDGADALTLESETPRTLVLLPPPTWVEIMLVDEEGNHIVDLPYAIQLSDGTARQGTSGNSVLRFDSIPHGGCVLSLASRAGAVAGGAVGAGAWQAGQSLAGPASGPVSPAVVAAAEDAITGLAALGPKRVGAAWSGLGSSAKYTYFAKGGRYRRYDWGKDDMNDGGSLPLLAFHLPADFRSGVDAAMNGYGQFAKYIYFFKGDRYVRYNWETSRVDYGPVSIAAEWKLSGPFASNLDAALCGQGKYKHYAYFFKGGEYARYDWNTGQVDLVAPLSAWGFPDEFLSGIDGACNGYGSQYGGKAFFFKGDRYVRYTWDADKGIDSGYPMDIPVAWPKLLLLEEPPTRRMVMYVTLDIQDHHTLPDRHHPNMDTVKTFAAEWRGNTYVDDFWYRELDAAAMADPHMLAMFLAGSYDEWVEYWRSKNSDPGRWQIPLDHYCSLLRTTRTPIFAVCGSHQVVGYAMANGWHAVAHMAPEGATPVHISEEQDGVFRAPNPRKGEVGVFGNLITSDGAGDPLLAGLPSPCYFVEYHHDEVRLEELPVGAATSLLDPDGLNGAEPKPGEAGEPESAAERCQAQALRYHVPPAGRVLYSTQFHPELPAASAGSSNPVPDQHGKMLLHNFFGVADSYWINNP